MALRVVDDPLIEAIYVHVHESEEQLIEVEAVALGTARCKTQALSHATQTLMITM
jgi:hypothetical protein